MGQVKIQFIILPAQMAAPESISIGEVKLGSSS